MGVAGARLQDVCFAHFPVDPAVLDTRLPHALSLATREGTGWVSLVGMHTRPLSGPVALPWAFAQLAVRTYVEADGTGAVYVLRVDVDSGVVGGLLRRLFGVAARAVDLQMTVDDDEVEIRTHAPTGRPLYLAAFDRTDDVAPLRTGTLDAWLTDRTTFALEDGRTGEMEHDPWRVASVDCHELRNELLNAEGLPAPAGEPLFRYSPGADVTLQRWPSGP